MLYIIVFNSLFFTLISSFFRNSGLFVFLLIPVMWTMFGANYSNADYANYLATYELQEQGVIFDTSQIGFISLMSVSSTLGLSYNGFLTIVSFIGILLIYSTITKYTDKPNFVFALYFIHPFFLDIVQVKHFLAMSIIVFSIRFLLEYKLASTYKYMAGVLVASSIHFIALFFLPLVFIKKINTRILTLLIIILSIIIFSLDKFNIIKDFTIKIAGETRIESYFDNRANLGFFVQFFIQLCTLAIVFYSIKILRKKNKSSNFTELILMINVYLLILFPFYVINGTFERAFRISLILDYILFSLTFNILSITLKPYYMSMLVMLVSLLFIWHVYYNYSEEVFYSIFENNYVSDYFSNGS